MRAVLSLEVIGENYRHHLRAIDAGKAPMPHMRRYIEVLRYGRRELQPWVARITEHGRAFVESPRDYSLANGIGSRGIYLYYALTPGVYEVNECVKLGRSRRYCIRVNDDGTYTEISREDVEAWLESVTSANQS